MFIKAN